MTASGPISRSQAVPILSVRTTDGRTLRFSRSFHIGREHDCAVRIEDVHVSRKHVLVSFEDGHWRIRDQHSGNGVFVDGRRVESAAIVGSLTIRLGSDGPTLVMDVESRPAPAQQPVTRKSAGETVILQSYAERYFGKGLDEEEVGGRTLMIRKAFHKVQRKQRRLYGSLVALALLAAVIAGGYAYYGHRQMLRQQAVAQAIFYDMKSLDVEIAKQERLMEASNNPQGQDQLKKTYLERRRQMQINYEQFISGLKLYDHDLSPQEQLILRVTRLFGECEMAAPPEYLAEVNSYIRKWQRTKRFPEAVARAQQFGYTRKIVEAFQGQNLPPQFFYLAMQESDFNEVAVGPPTRSGFAKGMWQFIPETARRFGLKTGPLVAYPRADRDDDRHQWEKATGAAARYIKEIYSTDAQASGLLVMASYNWGEGRVINMLRTMPANPRERNFWKVLERHRDRVPKETYDYVLNIVAAAVIGENPRLFGFALDSPLAGM